MNTLVQVTKNEVDLYSAIIGMSNIKSYNGRMTERIKNERMKFIYKNKISQTIYHHEKIDDILAYLENVYEFIYVDTFTSEFDKTNGMTNHIYLTEDRLIDYIDIQVRKIFEEKVIKFTKNKDKKLLSWNINIDGNIKSIKYYYRTSWSEFLKIHDDIHKIDTFCGNLMGLIDTLPNLKTIISSEVQDNKMKKKYKIHRVLYFGKRVDQKYISNL